MPEGYNLPRNPLSRDEIYLDILCGANRPLPPLPVLSRSEAYLRYLCENGGLGGGSGVAKGYYYNGNFYEDAAHTKLITPEEGNLYYDQDGKALYIYKNGDYAEIGDADIPVKDVQVDGESVVDEEGIAHIIIPDPIPPFPFESIEPVEDIDETYLAEVSYVALDYPFAKEYLDEHAPAVGGCTAIIRDGLFGRNYDWKYSNSCEFVVRTPAINGRHGVVGMVGNVNGLTKDFVKSGEYSDMYKVLPFMLTDGQNDHGLRMSINVVPSDKGSTTDTLPGYDKVNALMFVRWALDHCATVGEVIDATEGAISLYVPQVLRDMGYEVHFLVSDRRETRILEFVDNECVWTEHNIITNFFINGVTFKADGTVPVIGDSDISEYGLTNHAEGLERYNIAVNGAEEDIYDLLEDLKFTNTYTLENDIWYSELCSSVPITSPIEDFEAAMFVERAKYAERSRDTGDTWQTVHSSVYNGDMLVVHTQENYIYSFVFDIPVAETFVKDVKVNGVSVVDEDGDANVSVPTKVSDIENDKGYIANAVVEIAQSQIISQDPLKIQLTSEQMAIISNTENDFIRLDASALGIGVSMFYKAISNTGNEYVLTMNECNYQIDTKLATQARQDVVIIDISTMIGTYSVISLAKTEDIPEPSDFIEIGTTGQTTPSANLMVGGLFFKEV